MIGTGCLASPFAQAFRCVGVLDLGYGQAVVAYHRVIHQAYIGVSGTCALILERISDEPRVQVRLTAMEGVKHVFTPKLLNAALFTHC